MPEETGKGQSSRPDAELERRILNGERGVWLTGLVEGARALILSRLGHRLGRALLVVVPDDTALESYQRDLSTFATLTGRSPKRVVVLPALDADPYDGIAAHPEIVRERVHALSRLVDTDLDFLLVPARALVNLLPPPGTWTQWTTRVRLGGTVPPDSFVLQAIGLGYRRVDTVSAPGEVSRRGGIVDVFPPTADEPVRIELFGDTVESLRSFDTDNQRSTGKLTEILIGPAMESPPTDDAVRRVIAHLEAGLVNKDGSDADLRRTRELLDLMENQGYWPGFESLVGLTVENPGLLFGHTRDLMLVVDQPERVDDELIRAHHEIGLSYDGSGQRTLPPPSDLFGDAREVRRELSAAVLNLDELSGQHDDDAPAIVVGSRRARTYSGRVNELIEDLARARQQNVRTICVMRAAGSADRLTEILNENDLAPVRGTLDTDAPLVISIGPLRAGFELPDAGLQVLSERDVFGEEREATENKRVSRAAFVSDFRDLKKNAMVVHVDHGIARYVGLGRPRGGSLNRDFMTLEFAGGDRLFVPVDRLDLVQKYTGVAGHKPQLDRLGGTSWERIKAKVRKSVESMARDLLQLYARRREARGFTYSADTPWQRELEDAFPHDLTPDQQRALEEIKADMHSERPMDRLLVGDVGFGKTELAVRAAFKCVMDGRQCAMLTPTTVLSLQHFETFRERFAPYPVRVEMISRFRTATEIRSVLQDLAVGSVDVLIGTHRIFSKDVRFKQLGLMIVDEEQRFGVKHKERLKELSIGVDALAMTATPIPRTLQMSLAGVRDLSVIETPPPGRMAIQTYLLPFRKNVLAQAIRQELRRDGQVFVVHNRVETLPAVTRMVEEMVPDARVVAAHGQMSERTLESVMMRFIRREANVLVTTTIIENGLDIPDANTIIVNRADRFGLSQLYQLRGRVGRSRHHAYAYFVIPGRRTLSSQAAKRLRALQEFSELGAGFRLAAADLEIRGAGELLGARQHGHIGSLGFDLYCQMVERTVSELRGEPVDERKPASLNLGVDIKIPQSFLPESADRLVIYKRLAQASDAAEVDRLQAETEDRFGHLPQAARNLFAMAQLRVVAETLAVKSIDLADAQLRIRFHEAPPIEPTRIVEMVQRRGGVLRPSGALFLPAPPKGVDRIESVRELLVKMRAT